MISPGKRFREISSELLSEGSRSKRGVGENAFVRLPSMPP